MLKLAAAAAAAALLAVPYATRLPYPYDDAAAQPVADAFRRRVAGAEDGSAFPPAFEGAWAPNDRLTKAARLFEGQVKGSESVATLEDGTLVMLDREGWVFLSKPGTGKASKQWYVGPGRPLGFHAHGDKLVIACSTKGLLELDMATGKLRVLSNMADDTRVPLNYVNDLDVAKNGDVYFSSSTARGVVYAPRKGFHDTMHSYLMNLFSGDATGRLLKYEAATGRTTTLVDGLWYANGVAVARDEKSVLVVETNQNRVHRVDLATGISEIFVDKLPAVPDGVTRAPDGGFWIAGVVPLSPLPRLLAPYPRLRTLVAHVVGHLLPLLAKPGAFALKVDAAGAPADALYDLKGARVRTLSAVVETDGKLWLGNLGGDFVSVVDL